MTTLEEAVIFILETVNFGVNPEPGNKAKKLADQLRLQIEAAEPLEHKHEHDKKKVH
jgi:hypothetical protein